MRALRKHLEKIYRKLAMKIVQKADTARSSETVPEGVDGTASPSSGVTASGDGASAVLSGDEHSAASGTESEVASGEDDPAHTEPVLTAEAARAILADLASIESKDGSVEDSKRRHEQYVNMKAGYKLPLPDAEFGGNESGGESNAAPKSAVHDFERGMPDAKVHSCTQMPRFKDSQSQFRSGQN